MNYSSLRRLIPGWLKAHILHFECAIEKATAEFARSLAPRSLVLDAGAGEAQYAHLFAQHRYVGVDLGIGDASWNYRQLDCIADLQALPLRTAAFAACVNIVTLEHVCEPGKVVNELGRVLQPGGRLLLIVPHEWEVHQSPHDFFRYTCHGVRYLLDRAGFEQIVIEPVGGFFQLMSRRLWNALQFFPAPLLPLVAVLVAPAALLLPFLDFLDRDRNFTLGYICTACKS